MFIKNLVIISIFFGLSLFVVLSASAFSISPLKYTISLGSGDSKDLIVTVKNDSKFDKEYEAVLAGVQQDDFGRPIIKQNSDVAENWIKIQNNKIVLKSGEVRDLIFSITIPKNVSPGAHYFAIGANEKSVTNVGAQLMTVVVLQVAGVANEELVMEKFSSTKNYFFNKKISFILQLKNNGNIDLSLDGKLQIYNFKNTLINSSTINLGNKLFAQSNRVAQINPFLDNEKFWPGYYRSMVAVNYGLTKQQIIASVNFWYLPVWFLVVVTALFVLIILFFIIRKNRHERLG